MLCRRTGVLSLTGTEPTFLSMTLRPAINMFHRASSVLFNEETSDQKYKKFIVYVLGHEMAHQ